MSEFVIIPDSACDLGEDLRKRFGIPDYLRGVLYFPDGSEGRADLDWKQMSPEEFYDSMKGRKVLYKTASPSVGEVREIFAKYLEEGKDILCMSLSTGLSVSYSVYVQVAEDLKKEYPDRKVVVVDSLRYSTALALLTIMACEKKAEGATLEETAAYINDARGNIHQMGPMDDLFFLTKTGRISNFKAFFGTLVGVNPMADFNAQGLAEVVAKVKGKRAAFDATVRYMEKTIENPQDQIIFVAHSNRRAQAEALAEMIREKFAPKEIILNDVGMSCGASIGPGLCAAFYYGKKISEGLAAEKAIMDGIVAAQKK